MKVATMTSEKSSSSLLDTLRGAGEAWLAAGSALGGVMNNFASNLREDRTADQPSGAHAFASAADAEPETVAAQLRAAVDNARSAFTRADSDRDFRAAASTFANDAGAILRDVAGSLSRAGNATLSSGEAEEAKAAFGTAVGEARETFERAAAGVRNRAEESDIDAEGIIKDMRERFDGLVASVSSQFENRSATSENEPDIIDGDVVSDGDTAYRSGSASE